MRILVTAGGTGGHIYPAIAIVQEIKKIAPETTFLFVGSRSGLERRLAEENNIEYFPISAWTFNEMTFLWKVQSLFHLAKSVFSVLRKIRKFKPDATLTTGSYVSGASVIASKILGIPIYMHEQNSFPGMGNIKLAKFTKALFISYKESIKHFKNDKLNYIFTGNPIRREIIDIDRNESREKLGFNNKKVILSVGGSGGAASINEFVSNAREILDKNQDVEWIHVSGLESESEFTYDQHERLKIHKFINDFPTYMSACDLMISRSGALTLAEISVIGVACILVPSPNVTNNHQMQNALVYEKNKAAIILKDSELSSKETFEMISNLINNEEKLDSLRENSKKLSMPDAAEIIAKNILGM